MPIFQTRLTPELIERYTRLGHWGHETFYQILHGQAETHPDRDVLLDHRHRVTYSELRARVDRTAAAFQQLGVSPGDVVTIQLPNWIEFAYVFFALERLGAVANPIGPDFRSREVESILRFSESCAFVCPETFRGFAYIPMIQALRPHLPDLKTVCVLGSPGAPHTVSLDEMIYGQSALPPLVPQPLEANEIMRLAFTSGTTGNPKGVTHSCNTTLSACCILNDVMEVDEHDVFLIYLPLGLNWGYLTLLQAIMAGARAVLLDRFSARAALALIEREHVTFIPSAPASLIAMLNAPDLERFDLRSLRVVITGGASCPVETLHAFRARMPGHLLELYGMLETGFHTCTRLTDAPEAVTGTIGRPAAGMGLRLLDEHGDDVPAAAAGEIAAAGPSVHLGYHKNPAANAESFTADGWFRTGDLGQCDPAGNVRIVGRLKEMINRGGEKISPREIDEVLLAHPAVAEAVTFGVPHGTWGEEVAAAVVVRQTVSEDELIEYCRAHLAEYKRPKQIHITDTIPRTATGKVQRGVVARTYKQKAS